MSLLFAASVAACGGTTKTKAGPVPAAEPALPTETAAPEEADPTTTWEGFFPVFQRAIAAGDKREVEELIHIGEGLGREEFIEGYDVYFGDELKKVIAESAPGTWTPSQSEEGVYEVAWEETFVDDAGDEYGSALILYFKPFDGKYRLFRWMAAG